MLTTSKTQPRRVLGILYSAFPSMTRCETVLFRVSLGSAALAALFTGKNMSHDRETTLIFLLFFPGCVLAYWMRQAPAAMLQLLIFPYAGIAVRWPRFLQRCIQIFGVITLFSLTNATALLLSGIAKARTPWPSLVLASVCIAVTVIVMRKRKGVLPDSRTAAPGVSGSWP